jgi:FAD:protein FMN transferase
MLEFATVAMDTLVHVNIVSERSRHQVEPHVDRALRWFGAVEQVCSRFDPSSEVMQLSRRVGEPVHVSTALVHLVDFALALARLSEGAFDPTLGVELEQRGYATDYRTLRPSTSGIALRDVSFKDVAVDRRTQTITLRQPLVLDLNSVAKGLAIDLAVRELRAFDNLSIEAGGDLFARGRNANGKRWRVGIQDPRGDGVLARTLAISEAAVCTSGAYERGAHVLDGRTHQPVAGLASVTVVAPTALAADGFSTTALALGVRRGRELLHHQGLQGVLVTSEGEVVECP